MTSIVLFAAAGLVAGLVLGAALSRWQPAFPALFFAGVDVFLLAKNTGTSSDMIERF